MAFGEKLPVYSRGNPDLYLMCKLDGEAMSVGLWNMFADSVIHLMAELDEAYQEIYFINCNGRLEENRVFLSEIQPFAFAGFDVL